MKNNLNNTDILGMSQQIISDNPTLTSVEKLTIDMTGRKLSALERVVKTTSYYDSDEKSVTFYIYFNIKGEVQVKVINFLNEDEQDEVIFVIHRNNRLLVVDDDKIDNIVRKLNKLTLEYGNN